MNRSNERMLMLGALITLLGLVLLLSNLDALPVASGAMWGIMLSVSAVVFAVCYARAREQWWGRGGLRPRTDGVGVLAGAS
ncbi:MAG: hypothetical protein ACUVTG_07360 [Candidatus Oleimicrobiaceae bacterium]